MSGMMSFPRWVSLVVASSVVYSSSVLSDEQAEFAKYKQQETQAFQQYITDQNQAFNAYKAAYEKAQKTYQSDIQTVWKTPEVSTQTKWISYSENYGQKTQVDFAKDQVTISQVVAKGQTESQVKQALQQKLTKLANTTYQQAYQTDPVAKAVDTEMSKKVAPVLLKTQAPSKKIVPLLVEKPDVRQAKFTASRAKNLAKGQQVVTLTYNLKKKDVSHRIKGVLPYVLKEAQTHKMPPALLLAIIKNESAYNPMAKSHIPAYGLMQIVPSSAGKDATKFLFGKPKLLSSGYLYTPDKNVEVGAAYMHILNYRYLRKIKDPQSRLYCVIAAYNTGAGNVARAFTGRYNISKAAKVINQKTPQQVYQHLIRHLPYSETKHYLKKVSKSYRDYQPLFQKS